MRLQGYDFKLVARKGTEIPVADALSQAYLQDTGPGIRLFTVSSEEVHSVKQMSLPRIQEIREKTASDEVLQEVMKLVLYGWTKYKSQVTPVVMSYFECQGELNIINGIL